MVLTVRNVVVVVVKVSPRSREGSPALQKRPGPLQSDGGCVSSESNQSAPSSTQESLTDKTPITHTYTHTEVSVDYIC